LGKKKGWRIKGGKAYQVNKKPSKRASIKGKKGPRVGEDVKHGQKRSCTSKRIKEKTNGTAARGGWCDKAKNKRRSIGKRKKRESMDSISGRHAGEKSKDNNPRTKSKGH